MGRIECMGLSKFYGRTKGLDQVDLTLESGRIVGLLGPNGSGKTTMIKLANGLLEPSRGKILIDGMEPGPETKARVAYLPDRDFLPSYMKIRGVMDMYKDFKTLLLPYVMKLVDRTPMGEKPLANLLPWPLPL